MYYVERDFDEERNPEAQSPFVHCFKVSLGLARGSTDLLEAVWPHGKIVALVIMGMARGLCNVNRCPLARIGHTCERKRLLMAPLSEMGSCRWTDVDRRAASRLKKAS